MTTEIGYVIQNVQTGYFVGRDMDGDPTPDCVQPNLRYAFMYDSWVQAFCDSGVKADDKTEVIREVRYSKRKRTLGDIISSNPEDEDEVDRWAYENIPGYERNSDDHV